MSWSQVTYDSHRPDSTTEDGVSDGPPPGFFNCVLFIIVVITNMNRCYLELLADSISVSGNTSTGANWTVSLVTKSPSTFCDLSLYTINGSLLNGDKVIAESTTCNSHQQFVSQMPVTTMRFTTAKIHGVVGDGAVVWDTGVEILAAVKADNEKRQGFLTVTCRDLPVRLWSDGAGNMKGSLLGCMRRCDYLFRLELEHCLNKWLSGCRKSR